MFATKTHHMSIVHIPYIVLFVVKLIHMHCTTTRHFAWIESNDKIQIHTTYVYCIFVIIRSTAFIIIIILRYKYGFIQSVQWLALHKWACREYLWRRLFVCEPLTNIVDMKWVHFPLAAMVRRVLLPHAPANNVAMHDFVVYIVWMSSDAIQFDRKSNKILLNVYRNAAAADYYCRCL